jgi:SOS-response transcriptional repressor LexA
MNFLADKLAAARRENRLKAKDMALMAGISAGYYSEIENGKKEPGESLVKKFAEILSRNLSYFFEGLTVIGETPTEYRGTRSNVRPVPVDLRWVPVISWAHAGQAQAYEELPTQWQNESVPTTCRDEKAFGLIIEGDSMEPRCMPGDRVVIMPSEPPRNGCLVVAKLKNDGVLLRRFMRLPDGRIRLIAYNEIYPAMDYESSEFHWIYPVSETVRKEWS